MVVLSYPSALLVSLPQVDKEGESGKLFISPDFLDFSDKS